MADEPKIIVDEGWKARAQREKEEARKKAEEVQAQQPEAVDAEDADMEEDGQAQAPTFLTLISSLTAQAMMALGVLVPRDAKQVYIDLDGAKFSIDLLMMLREKTKGNLTPQEEGRMTATIAELQQVYVARVQQVQESQMQGTGIDPGKLHA